MAAYKRDKAIQIAKSEGIQSLLGIGFMVREIALAGVALPQLGAISHGGSSSAKELPGEVAKSHPETITSAGYGLTEVNGVAGETQLTLADGVCDADSSDGYLFA